MLRKFDPNKNPYADDLLRLYHAPSQRYTQTEKRVLARILASKLYQVQLTDQNYVDWHYGDWVIDDTKPGRKVDFDVLFDTDLKDIEQTSHLHGYTGDDHAPPHHSLIILAVGVHGVTELYNGKLGEHVVNALRHAAEQLADPEGSENRSDRENEAAVPPRSDDEAAKLYAGTEQGGGNRGGGDGNGANNGGNGPNGGPGSGGVVEVLSHPVLFSVERDVFDAILEQI